jgi:hypothetical protein
MSSLLASPFMEDSIQEVVPDVAKVAGKLAASSVLTARRRVRMVPQSGQNYTVSGSGGANTVNILLQDGQSYLDPLSAVLSFEVEASLASGEGTVALDDGAFSVFRRLLVSVNSTLMDDTDFVPKKALAELYATVGQEWYNNVGSMMGLYKASTGVYGTDAASGSPNVFVDKYNVAAKQALAAKVVATGSKKNKFFVPLCLLSSFFRNETLLPLRNIGQLYIQLNLASALEACVCSSATATPQFQVKNLTLEADFIDLHPTYVSMMDEIMERPGGEGVRWAFDAHLVAAQNMTQSSGAGPQSVIISKASQNLRSVQVVVQSKNGLSHASYAKQSTFANPGFVDIQTRIGSLYFPAFASIGEHRAYADLQNAFGRPVSSDKSGIVDLQNYYCGTTALAGSAPALTTNYPWNGGLDSSGAAYQAECDMWMWAYCFDKLKAATLKGLDLDGINTLTSSGSQIVIQLNADTASVFTASGDAPVLTGIVRFTRILEIKGGATRVIG